MTRYRGKTRRACSCSEIVCGHKQRHLHDAMVPNVRVGFIHPDSKHAYHHDIMASRLSFDDVVFIVLYIAKIRACGKEYP